MKSIIYILSFILLGTFFAPCVNAQSIEQISYIPVKRGNYEQLMVKKKAYFGGDLTVTDTLTSFSTFLNLTANNTLLFKNNPNINVNNNVFLAGSGTAEITNNIKVYSGNILSMRAGTLTQISKLDNANYLYSQTLTGTGNIIRLGSLTIDGIRFPSDCNYTWQNVTTAEGANYTILRCS